VSAACTSHLCVVIVLNCPRRLHETPKHINVVFHILPLLDSIAVSTFLRQKAWILPIVHYIRCFKFNWKWRSIPHDGLTCLSTTRETSSLERSFLSIAIGENKTPLVRMGSKCEAPQSFWVPVFTKGQSWTIGAIRGESSTFAIGWLKMFRLKTNLLRQNRLYCFCPWLDYKLESWK